MIPLLLALLPAHGWSGVNEEGLAASRNLWVGEHVDLYAESLARAGYATSEPVELPIITQGGDVAFETPSLLPALDWGDGQASAERRLTPAMFANLPDLAFSVGDWALGHERCPLPEGELDALTEARCLYFIGMLGALNSTHFPPQSRSAHAWYHQLAIDNARRCDAMADAMAELGGVSSGRDDLVDDLLTECQVESLVYEGVAHHYLQDMFSSGHGWQRWGSPRLADWIEPEGYAPGEAMTLALLVGSAAGFIHGNESVTGLGDPMCYPDDDVFFDAGDGSGPFQAVGDYHLDEATPQQRAWMQECTDLSLGEVVTAFGDANPLGLTPARVGSWDAERCFGLRNTNLAFYTGIYGAPAELDEEGWLRWFARLYLEIEEERLPRLWAERGRLDADFRKHFLVLAVTADAARWRTSPGSEGTELAELVVDSAGTEEELTFLEIARNQAFVGDMATHGLPLFDPAADVIAGKADATSDKHAEDADAIRRVFAGAHADHWCEALDPDSGELAAARADCRGDATGDARDAACQACALHAQRFVRFGEDADRYDAAAVCDAFGHDGGFIYAEEDVDSLHPVEDAARNWCGGGRFWAITDSAVYMVSAGFDIDGAAEGITELAVTETVPKGAAAWGDNLYFSGTNGTMYEVLPFLADSPFGGTECQNPDGMSADPTQDVLYVACEDNDTVASYDLTRSPPTLIDTLYLPDLGGFPEQPVDVAVHPDGDLIAVATAYLYGGRDGITLIETHNGVFGDGLHVNEFGSYAYAASRGVGWASRDRVYASNFSSLDCPGGSSASCTNRFYYWVNGASVDFGVGTLDQEVRAGGRSTNVTPIWGDRVIVAGFTTQEAYVIGPGRGVPLRTIKLPTVDRADSFAPVPDAGRIFVGMSHDSATCGLGVIDASSESLSGWAWEGLDESLGCVRRVVAFPEE